MDKLANKYHSYLEFRKLASSSLSEKPLRLLLLRFPWQGEVDPPFAVENACRHEKKTVDVVKLTTV